MEAETQDLGRDANQEDFVGDVEGVVSSVEEDREDEDEDDERNESHDDVLDTDDEDEEEESASEGEESGLRLIEEHATHAGDRRLDEQP